MKFNDVQNITVLCTQCNKQGIIRTSSDNRFTPKYYFCSDECQDAYFIDHNIIMKAFGKFKQKSKEWD